MGRVLIVGGSHALQLARAMGVVTANWQEATRAVIPIQRPEQQPEAHLLYTTPWPSFLTINRTSRGKYAASFASLFDQVREFNQPDVKMVLGIGGNEHNKRFMYRQKPPFDFHLPTGLATDPSRQIIPLREMRRTMDEIMSRALVVTAVIAAELPQAVRYYLAPPPPIGSEEHIRKEHEIFDFEANEVEDPLIRLKVYELYLERARLFCESHGLRYLPPVAEHRDELGFLKPTYWSGSTHAAPEYYRPLIDEHGL